MNDPAPTDITGAKPGHSSIQHGCGDIPHLQTISLSGGIMEFLVHIRLRWAPDMEQAEIERISREERAHAAELAKKGHLVRMWRVPCRFENWGLWRAKDATELHEVITSLPAYPYMYDVDVQPLARHAVDPMPYDA